MSRLDGAQCVVTGGARGIGRAICAAFKAAIRNHTKTVTLYAAQQGWAVRCNSVHPAAVLTPMWEPMLGDGPEREANMAALVADTPLKRFGTPEEAPLYVCSSLLNKAHI